MKNKEVVILDEKNKLLSLVYKEKKININIIYRKRKSISIKITPKEKIDIISPRSVSLSYLKEVVIRKVDWIIKNLDKYEDLDDSFEDRKYEDGEIFYYLGKEYQLKLLIDKNSDNYKKNYCNIEIKDNYLQITTNNSDKEYIKTQLKKWFKIESEKIVLYRLEHLKKENSIMRSLEADIIKIKEQKKRWGSCTSTKSIYINSRISMADIDAIDYILIHEFCHLVHMNHSKDFYNLVRIIMPNYKEAENWLRENGYKLTI